METIPWFLKIFFILVGVGFTGFFIYLCAGLVGLLDDEDE